MGKVVAIEHVTLDGVMQGPAHAGEDRRDGFALGGWAAARSDPMMQQAMGAHMAGGWALLMGRVTYEDLYDAWGRNPTPNPFSEALAAVQKFVASTTLARPLAWRNSTLLEGDVGDAVATLRREHPAPIIILGSAALVQSLMPRGVVDEYLLMIHPVVLGAGRRLFEHGSEHTPLELVSSVATPTGVVIAHYVRPRAS